MKQRQKVVNFVRFITGFFIIIPMHGAGIAAVPDAPTGLLCELSKAPLGVKNVAPRFSWIVNDKDNNETQTGYQIQVNNLFGVSVWGPLKVSSDASVNVPYGGAALATGSVYYWKVKTWDMSGNESAFSDPQMIVTALGASEWTATPIWSSAGNFAFVRTQTTLPSKTITKAIAFVTGRNTNAIRQYVYRFYINGALVGVGPSRAGSSGTIFYNVFDVTRFLTTGVNALGAVCCSMDPEKDFLMQLRVFYDDGTSNDIVTNTSWKSMNADPVYNMGPPYYTYYQMGPENINMNTMPAGWNNTGYSDASWQSAVAKTAYVSSLHAQPQRSLEVTEQPPVKTVNKGNGDYFIDFGQEIMAGIKITCTGRSGDRVIVRLGEEISSTNTVKWQARTAINYNDSFTVAAGKQTMENFGYRAFRYGEILVPSTTTLDTSAIRALVTKYPFDSSMTRFSSSDTMLNHVWDLCAYSVKATNADIANDCPTRERGSYPDDNLIRGISFYNLDREFNFQRNSTQFCILNLTNYTEQRNMPIFATWEDFMATGDTALIQPNYSVLKTLTTEQYFSDQNFLTNKAPRTNGNDLVDWPWATCTDSFVFTDNNYNAVVNAWNYKAMEYMSKIADLLGKGPDRDAYKTRMNGAKNAINKYMYDPARGAYRDGMLSTADLAAGTGKIAHYAIHSSFFPLTFGITPDSNKTAVINYLKSRGMACSPYGARFLLEGLYLAGDETTPLQLMTAKTTNSWYHMEFVLGATCVTEAWDPSEKPNMSFAHPWATAPTNLIPRYLMGITAIAPAYKKISIRPQPGTLGTASITVPTIRGPVSVSLTNASNYVLKISLPVTMTAQVYFPKKGATGTLVYVDNVQKNGVVDGNFVVFDSIGSGSHVFSTVSQVASVLDYNSYGADQYCRNNAAPVKYVPQQSEGFQSVETAFWATQSDTVLFREPIDAGPKNTQTPGKTAPALISPDIGNKKFGLLNGPVNNASVQRASILHKVIIGKALLQGRKNHYGTLVSLVCDSLKAPVAITNTFANGEYQLSCAKTGKFFLVCEPMGAYSREYASRRIRVYVHAGDSVFINPVVLPRQIKEMGCFYPATK
jgi:Alpha-L-rhamnosidase N-terminal domain./Bacterial alpha-L-rhamnosidase.